MDLNYISVSLFNEQYLWDLIKMGSLHGEEGNCCSSCNKLVFTVDGINLAFVSVSAMPGLSLSYLYYKKHQNSTVGMARHWFTATDQKKPCREKLGHVPSGCLLKQGKNPLFPLLERTLIYNRGNAPRYLSCHSIVRPGSRTAGFKCWGSQCPKYSLYTLTLPPHSQQTNKQWNKQRH